jgi:hypothetical protein
MHLYFLYKYSNCFKFRVELLLILFMREREQSLIVVISLESIFDTYVFAHYSFLLFLYLFFVVMCTFEAPLMGKKRDGRDFFFSLRRRQKEKVMRFIY